MAEPPNLEQLREARSQVGERAGNSWRGAHFLVRQEVVEAADFLLSVLDDGGKLVVERDCPHGALEPHGWVCGEHDSDEKCPRQNCEAYLDFGDHCARLHRDDDACWSASACGGGSRRRVFPRDP